MKAWKIMNAEILTGQNEGRTGTYSQPLVRQQNPRPTPTPNSHAHANLISHNY